MIYIGFEKGSSNIVEVPLQHTIIASQTRYGKSTTLIRMMLGLPDDFQVLCLDVKDPRDFEDAGYEVPIFIENKTDPLMLKQLLEQQSHLWLRKEFPELIELCKKGDAFENVLERVIEKMGGKVHPVVRDRLKVLRLLLEKLVDNMKSVSLSDKLELNNKVNVMNLSKVPDQIKQLAVYSSVKEILTHYEKTVIVIDELPDFAPQRYRTPSKSIITQAIRKGGAKNVWLWLSGQTMTGVDKQVLKQAMIWILGHQREINEAKRTLDQIPFKTDLKLKDIMTLPKGHFIVCTDYGAYLTYVQPSWLDGGTARKVALGEITSEQVLEDYLEKKEGDDEMVYKEKYEKLKQEFDEFKKGTDLHIKTLKEKLSEERNKVFKEAMEKVEKIKKEWNVEELQETIMQLKDEKNELHERLRLLELNQEAITKIKDGVSALLSNVEPSQTNVNVSPEMIRTEIKEAIKELLPKTIDLEHVETTYNISHSEEPTKLTTKTQQGQIMFVALNDLKEKEFTETEMSQALLQRGWNIKHTSLAPTLGGLAKTGLLIRIPKTRPTCYVVPSKVKINVED